MPELSARRAEVRALVAKAEAILSGARKPASYFGKSESYTETDIITSEAKPKQDK
jgi:hypothetical protein